MDADSRPETSPYEIPSVALNFEGGCTLYISPHLLAESQKLEAFYLDNPLYFLNVSHDAGHVLVHYLITGTYQSLKPGYLLSYDNIAAEFSTGVRVYTAAKTFALPSLVELAKAEIERLGERLQLSLVFNLLQMAYPAPDTDDMWISNYLKNRVKIFLKDGFMEPLVGKAAVPDKTVPISHILFKGMLELFQENTISLREEIKGTFEAEERAARVAAEAAKAAAIAEEEAEIAQLIDKRDTSFMGLNRSGEKRLRLLQAKAARRADEQAAREAEEQAAREAEEQAAREAEEQAAREAEEQAAREAEEQAAREAEDRAAHGAEEAAREAERAAKEDKGKGKKGKRGKKNNNSNMIVIEPLPEQPEGYLVVKAQQETNDKTKENKDESRALYSQKPFKSGKKQKKSSETNAPIVHSSDGSPSGKQWQESNPNDEKEVGWSFWGFGENKKRLEKEDWATSPPTCSTDETELYKQTTEPLDKIHEDIITI